MTNRERFMTAFKCGQPDKVPITEVHIAENVILAINGMIDGPPADKTDYFDIYVHVLRHLNLDALCVAPTTGVKKISTDIIRDKFDREFQLSPHGEPLPSSSRVSSIAELKGFSMADKLAKEDLQVLERTMETFGPDMGYCFILSDPYKESWKSIGGMQNLLICMMEYPELAAGLFRVTTDYLHGLIDMAADMGVESYIMPGDYAMETGLIFSLDLYRKFLKPMHIEIIDHVHERGGLIAKHSDGDDWKLIPDWVEIGFDGFHPVQPQCMDIGEVKEYLKGKMAVLGNIDCRTLLVTGTPEEVRQTVKETISIAAPGGGYIMTSSNSVHPGCKPENYLAMVETLHEFGNY